MTTTRDKEQTFVRLFRMMDSPFEGEASSAFRQARRMLQDESATFGAILDHTQHLTESNMALGDQNQDLHRENEQFRTRADQLGFARAALTRLHGSPLQPAETAGTAFESTENSEAIPVAPRPAGFSWNKIPKDLRTLIGIFAFVAVATVSCHMLASNNPDSSKQASPTTHGWLARLPANFSVDHPPWCFSCRKHEGFPGPEHQEGPPASGPARLPANFSIDHPPWCPVCRRQSPSGSVEDQPHSGESFQADRN
jgi:hypothetical protein